ncbi:uncharacterized protein LOC124167367 isoform X2 [Ischnura elegans]|uniref:uncharacterized protein LOC124167367 isoform X2 n=1 Tax=Ischnura elegans TaxID=197161 RepID=UPI001ED87B92|nr:uncharacterized protein LOC124167367 isoform X2 [Ischnura elegans]
MGGHLIPDGITPGHDGGYFKRTPFHCRFKFMALNIQEEDADMAPVFDFGSLQITQQHRIQDVLWLWIEVGEMLRETLSVDFPRNVSSCLLDFPPYVSGYLSGSWEVNYAEGIPLVFEGKVGNSPLAA